MAQSSAASILNQYGNSMSTAAPGTGTYTPSTGAQILNQFASGNVPPAVAAQEPTTARAANVEGAYGTAGEQKISAAGQAPTPLAGREAEYTGDGSGYTDQGQNEYLQEQSGKGSENAQESFSMGATDPLYGYAQNVENFAPTRWLTQGLQYGLQKVAQVNQWAYNKAGMPGVANAFGDAAVGFTPQSESDFNQIVNDREANYDADRTEAGQTGMDWWRLAGQAAITALLAVGGGSTSIPGRIATGAKVGAAVGAGQPVANAPGGIWWDKTKDIAQGAAGGATISGAAELAGALAKPLATELMTRFGPNPSPDVVNKTLNAALTQANTDPSIIPVPVIKTLKDAISTSLKTGQEPSIPMIAARLKAESLPVPMHLTVGEASGEAKPYTAEHVPDVAANLSGQKAANEAAAVKNLDFLGADNAPSKPSAGNYLADRTNAFWQNLTAKSDALYDTVRNSQGLPAAMDGATGVKNIKDVLDSPEELHVYQSLPANIRQTFDDIEDGSTQLTVASMQTLDKSLGRAAIGQPGDVAHAIKTARSMLWNSPIDDELGTQAKQSYLAARNGYAQQMSMVEPKLPNGQPNPNYNPLLDSVVYKGTAPEKLFDQHFLNAPPSVASKNLAFMQNLDPNSQEYLGRTLMGEIKSDVTGNSPAERTTVSEAKLRGWAHGDKAGTVNTILPQDAANRLTNLADTVTNIKKVPVGASVNTSGTASALYNLGKAGATYAESIGGKLPLARSIAEGVRGGAARNAATKALQPGVSLGSILRPSPVTLGARKAGQLLTPTGANWWVDQKKAQAGGNQ